MMRTPEDFLELQAENEELYEKLNFVLDSIAELKLKLVDLVGPKERSRPEVLLALQALATRAGVPSRCERRECRRKGACCADDPYKPACSALWTDELAGRYADMAAGIALSAICIDREAEALQAALLNELGFGGQREKARAAAARAWSKQKRTRLKSPGKLEPPPGFRHMAGRNSKEDAS